MAENDSLTCKDEEMGWGREYHKREGKAEEEKIEGKEEEEEEKGFTTGITEATSINSITSLRFFW